MKKFLLIFIALSMSIGLFAQKGFHLGFGIMPQNTWIMNERDIDESRTSFKYQPTIGYAGLLSIGYNIKSPFGIHLNVIYSKQGQNHTSRDTPGRIISTSRDQTYLKFPLFFHVNSDLGKSMFTLGFGPSLGILLNASYEETDEESAEVMEPYDAKNLYINSYMGVAFKLGGIFALGDRLAFNLDIRGDYALNDVENKSARQNGESIFSPTRGKTQNLTIGAMMGLTFIFSTARKYYCE